MTRMRTSSRLIKKERKKLWRQIWLFLIISFLLVVGFLFFVLPNFIAITSSLFGGDAVVEETDVIPPQVPLISAPPEATSEPQILISGYAEANSTVVILLNQTEYERLTAGEDGTFEITVSLEEGENSIAAYAIDGSENESAVSRSYEVSYDFTAPDLSIDDLEDGKEIKGRENQTLLVRGVTDPAAKVSINGRVVYPGEDGAFSMSYYLAEGPNELVIVAEDKAGNNSEQKLTVNFSL